VNTVAVIGRMLLALVFVLGIMWALARWARKPMGAGKGEQVLTVLARQQINRTSSVTVLRVMDRALVLGVTEQGVRLLTETELAPIEEVLAAEPASSRSWPKLRLPAGSSALETFDSLESPVMDEQNPTEVSLAKAPVRPAAKRGSLDGSVLSPNTWRQVLSSARDLTVRR
jgi:flagellar biogenesis protein FliO